MKLNSEAIANFKESLVESMNDDVYYHLKHWIHTEIDDDQNFDQVLDYFCDNLHGSLQWID